MSMASRQLTTTPATLGLKLKATEVADVMRSMANGNSVGPDQLLAELLKLGLRVSWAAVNHVESNRGYVWSILAYARMRYSRQCK